MFRPAFVVFLPSYRFLHPQEVVPQSDANGQFVH